MKAASNIFRSLKERLRRKSKARQKEYNDILAKEAVTHIYVSDETDENGETCPVICIDGVKVLKVCTVLLKHP